MDNISEISTDVEDVTMHEPEEVESEKDEAVPAEEGHDVSESMCNKLKDILGEIRNN